MTDIKDTLATLSEAATQGEWTVCVYDCGDTPHYDHNGPCPSIQSESEDCAIVHWDGFKQEYWSSANGNGQQISANAAFIVALVNAYRSGQLVPVPSVEVVARVIADALGDIYDQVPINKSDWNKARGMCGGFPRDINMPFRTDYDAAATAVIASLAGGPDHG